METSETSETKKYKPLLKYGKYGESGQLYDALATGCNLPYANHSVKSFDTSVWHDIEYLVHSDPEFLKFNEGTLRCRDAVTPLGIACYNDNIPIFIIDFLLKNGANPHDEIKFNGYECDLIDDLKSGLGKNSERLIEIQKLFNKYREKD